MMKIKLNSDLIKIIISAILFILSLFFKDNIYLILLVCSYLVVSYEIFIDAVKKIFQGEIFDENTLMIIATISAFIIGEYPEAVMVMLLFEFGEYLSDLAVDNSKESITKLMDLRSDYVNLKNGDKVEKVDIKKARVGDLFLVKPGEKVPLDGVIVSGNTSLDTSSLTGESIPKEVNVGDSVLSGFVNGSGLITVKATSEFSNSTASKIINMLENSNEKKTKAEKFITRFSKIYTPIVVLLAILLVLIPMLLGGNFNEWFYKALVFLVTACPCALVISVPLGFFCGVGRASREGILIKSSDGLDSLNKLETIIFDKTGTITEGKFEVRDIVSNGVSKEELLKYAAYLEYYSNHPIALSIVKAYNGKIDESEIKDYKELSGQGVKGIVFSKKLMIGSENLFSKEGIVVPKVKIFGTVVYVICDDKYIGYLVIGDKIKESANNLVNNLKKIGINRTVMLSGDNKDIVREVANKVNIDEYYAELLPIDKVEKLKEIKKTTFTAFVGDGINDAPVIKEADLGISMGSIGSDAAIEASDVVLMHDNLSKIPLVIKIAKVTQSIVKFNIVFALGFKLLMLVLATFGFASIWMAVFADVGVTLLAVLNSLRIMKIQI
mgnify:CR=1 FL=1